MPIFREQLPKRLKQGILIFLWGMLSCLGHALGPLQGHTNPSIAMLQQSIVTMPHQSLVEEVGLDAELQHVGMTVVSAPQPRSFDHYSGQDPPFLQYKERYTHGYSLESFNYDYDGTGFTFQTGDAPKTTGNLATTPLNRNLGGLSDDALVHFGPDGYTTINPGAGGEIFSFRYGDIKHLTPRQVESVIGPLSGGGQTGAARVLHVLDEAASGATQRPGAIVPDIPEFVFPRPVPVREGFIVQ